MARLTRPPLRVAMMPSRVAPMPKRTDPFYQSREWLALIARRKRDPDYAAAKARGKHGERLVLDHVIERKDGGADLDPANTQWLTFSEHQAKTARSKAARIGWR
jgi:5-methylcytosine-specific restriction enzyme A